MKILRIAFITSEFVTEKIGGGLASYLDRVTQALKALGHEPEVFVTSSLPPSVFNYQGIRIERVAFANSLPLHVMAITAGKALGGPWGGPTTYLKTALGLARALERRHLEQPFDFVQSSNCGASGLFVRRMPGRPHLVRLSSHRALWFEVDGQRELGARLMARLERACVSRADTAYAPSQFVADQCHRSWRADVKVLRPPIFVETIAADTPAYLPERYLIHFGQIGARKGSDTVAAALPQVWREAPDFKMVWAGNVIKNGEYERCHALWGEQASNVLWLGSVRKEQLYAMLQGAEAAVLPSRVDNLPNTVIESLMFGIPVIGSRGASIDELVEPGASGELVTIGDAEALAEVMLKVWRREVSWTKDNFVSPKVLEELEPELAAQNLIRLAGCES